MLGTRIRDAKWSYCSVVGSYVGAARANMHGTPDVLALHGGPKTSGPGKESGCEVPDVHS